jgi:uncharacterized membrane protein YgcG
MRKLLIALLAAFGFSLPAQAQQIYTQPELDALLAPIALYPDALLTQVLIASTYPEQVEAAAKLPRDAQPDESWDPNVKALLSFPEVLNRMAGSPQWTRDLGQAFLGQEPHVMDTVQGLRKRAQSNGQLQSNDQQRVYEEERAIVVEPRRPEVVYVPYYDPYVVYGGWWWPGYYPVVWRPWAVAPVFVSAGFFFARPVWGHRHVVVNHVHWRGHAHHHGHGYVPRTLPAKAAHAMRPVDGKVVVRDYHRVPESRRQPIVQSGTRPQERNFQSHPEPRQGQNRPESRQGQNRPESRHSQSRPESRQQHAPAPRTSMPAAPRFSEARTQQAPRAAAPHAAAPQSRAPMPQQSRAPAPQQPRAMAPQQPRFSAQQGGGGRGGEMRGNGGGGGQRGGGGHGGGGRGGGHRG